MAKEEENGNNNENNHADRMAFEYGYGRKYTPERKEVAGGERRELRHQQSSNYHNISEEERKKLIQKQHQDAEKVMQFGNEQDKYFRDHMKEGVDEAGMASLLWACGYVEKSEYFRTASREEIRIVFYNARDKIKSKFKP